MAKKESRTESGIAETPLMKQYNAIKARHPQALLLFRVGDFYETFGEDAVKASKILGIVLTKRANGAAAYVDLAGFPHHALDTYLPKLVRAGEKVAICDQLEDPKLTKTIVKRGVTELVTPGVTVNDNVLDRKSNNFLAAVHVDKDRHGIAFMDISTGEFLLAEGNSEYIDKLLQGFQPSEIIVQRKLQNSFREKFGEHFLLSLFDDWLFTPEFSNEILNKHFGTISLKGFGVEELERGVIAAGAVLHYLSETQHDRLGHINKLSRIDEGDYVWLDRFTIRNLELIQSQHEKGSSLLDVMDQTITPMGGRTMRRWMVLPLRNRQKLQDRHDLVEALCRNDKLRDFIARQINEMGDLERLAGKVAIGRVNPRELQQLGRSLAAINPLREVCRGSGLPALIGLADRLHLCELLVKQIGDELQMDAPALVQKGGVIAKGVDPELDDLRVIVFEGKDYLIRLQQTEVQRTGISSLKVAYNNVFGYYLEVTNAHKDKVPSDWHRKQTLVNAERYITPELKEYEEKIVGAQEKIFSREQILFDALVARAAAYIVQIQENARLIGGLDCLLSFAVLARTNNYVRPVLDDSFSMEIKDGRHPVIETRLPPGEEYIPNDIVLDPDEQQIIILTGPNMSGKSALLRQTALIVLMAQMGSFVPASSARLGMVDKVFTRVGASDNISSGESTFMVEMNEAASILNNISDRCLIVLDEIGRGTATYDGISIAWSIAEFLHEHPMFRAKTLFATHYHELNEMAASMRRIRNYHIGVKELGNKVIFLRKLMPGGSEHSFGIHVARMAGMPASALRRAEEILKRLEESHSSEGLGGARVDRNALEPGLQLSFIQLDDPLLFQIKDEIMSIDINTLTPVEALMKLNDIKRLLGGNKRR
jgi:DNA mismatch repair protein MutS